MAAILGMGFEAVEEVAREAAQGQVCAAANDNDPSQVVVSGHRDAVERAGEIAKGKGAKRVVMLPVSAPFHCDLMEPAARTMAEALSTVEHGALQVPLVANVEARPVTDPATICSLLVDQVTGNVRWRESVEYMVGDGVTEVWELGAGKALCGMARRIDRSLATRAIGAPEDVIKAAEALAETRAAAAVS